MTPQITKVQQKEKKNNLISMIVSILIIIGLVIFGIYIVKSLPRFQNNDNPDQQTGQETPNTGGQTTPDDTYSIGKVLNGLEGTLSKEGNLYFFDSINNEEFRAQSSQIYLNDYLGKVKIKATIIDKKNNMWLLDILEIVPAEKPDTPDPDEQLTGDQQTTPTSFNFGQYGLTLDFQNNTGYAVNVEDGNIMIKQVEIAGTGQAEYMLSIAPFVCKAGSATQDCEVLQTRFENLQFENFISANGIKYYKIVETDKWIFFNDNMWGYYVYPVKPEYVTQLSKYIHTMTKTQIINKIKPIAANICKSQDVEMSTVGTINIQLLDGVLKGTIIGADINNNEIKCNVQIDPGDSFVISIESIQRTGNIYKQESADEDSTSTETTTETLPQDDEQDDTSSTDTQTTPSSQESADEADTSASAQDYEAQNEELQDMLKFSSNRGFTMYMPSNVAYEGVGIDSTDLGISGLTCIYKVNIINYKQKENLSSNPAIQAYLCSTDMDDETLSSKANAQGLIYKSGQDSGAKFLIKYQSPAKPAAESIVVY